jgi:hypothetical protein
MTAAMLVLEPIFEADLPPEQYAYRPRRNAQQAVVEVEAQLLRGHPEVVDADLADYLDRVSYYTLVHEAWPKRSGCEQKSLRRRPFLRPHLTWMASISPRLTRCHTVCHSERSLSGGP